MYLAELIVINYRSCRDLYISLDGNNPNILIGINDCGKSSILQAIGLLLEYKPKFNFVSEDRKKNDISNTRIGKEEFKDLLNRVGVPEMPYSEQQSIVIGRFMFEDGEVAGDEVSDHLKWVAHKSADRTLWLARIFDENERSFKTMLLTPDAVEMPALYALKSQELTRRKNALNLSSAQINNENKSGRYSNIELITAIYNCYSLQAEWANYDFDKGFWPEFRYLDWNISLDQLKQFANDAVSRKIAAQVELAVQYASQQAQDAQLLINEEFKALVESLSKDLKTIKAITANVNFQINSLVTDIFVEKDNSDGSVHLESQGDGIKRQIWFALIKWNALNTIESGKTNTRFIWCFDEPETHLYPKAQREFFELIKHVSASNVQSVISTHSTVFIDRASLTSIKKVDLLERYTVCDNCKIVDDIYQSLQIKNSDFLFFDRFLVVEGDTESVLIPHLYELHFKKSLVADNVQLINLGGKGKRRENYRILCGILEGFRKEISSSIVHIFDSDILADLSEHERNSMNLFCVGKQDIEDSINNDVWVNLLNNESSGRICMSVNEIQQIKDCIPDAKQSSINANGKFYARLRSNINLKLRQESLQDLHDFLPAKGIEWGRMLARYITNIGEVDKQVMNAFAKLKS